MNVIIFAIIFLLGLGSEAHFDPQISALGNIVMSIGNHLFARFTDNDVPYGYENRTFIDQVSYIHQMLSRMRDYFVNPPEDLKDQLRCLTQSFSFQVKVQLPKLNLTDKDLKEKYELSESQIGLFQSMASDCVRFVDEIIETRGEEIPDKYT